MCFFRSVKIYGLKRIYWQHFFEYSDMCSFGKTCVEEWSKLVWSDLLQFLAALNSWNMANIKMFWSKGALYLCFVFCILFFTAPREKVSAGWRTSQMDCSRLPSSMCQWWFGCFSIRKIFKYVVYTVYGWGGSDRQVMPGMDMTWQESHDTGVWY